MFKIYPLQYLTQKHARLHEGDTCLMVRNEISGEWRNVPWIEANGKVQSLAEGLVRLGVEIGDRVGTFSENFAEFIYSDLALLSIRAVGIPLYSSLSPEQVRFIAVDSGLKVLFVGEQYQYDTAYPVAEKLGIRLVTYSKLIRLHPDDHSTLTFEEVLQFSAADPSLEEKVALRRSGVRDEDTAFILYTSGTSGDSKGVMLSYENIMTQMRHQSRMPGLKAHHISFNFLPLTHIFEKMWTLLCLECNIAVAVNTDPHRVTETLPEVRPHYMCNVPRFWEKVYFGVLDKIENVTPTLSKMMQDCIKVSRKVWLEYKVNGRSVPVGLALKYKFYDLTLLSILRKKVGLDRGVLFPVSGAALSREIHGFLLSIGVPIVYGYGMTETTATVAFEMPDDTKLGSVGRVVGQVAVRIDEEAGGELLVKGPSVMKGYFNRPEDNAKSFTPDGFFRTGDLMRLDADNYLYFKERSKDLYKTANGKYIAPQMIENLILSEGVVEQVLVVADRRNFVSALIYPNWPKVTELLKKEGLKDLPYGDTEALRARPEVYSFIETHIDGALSELARHEQVKKFYILPEPFSIENGQLTPSMKKKRSVILEAYKKEIDDIYGYSL